MSKIDLQNDHLHLVPLQILENHFVDFHPVLKLLQHYHTYSNINTLTYNHYHIITVTIIITLTHNTDKTAETNTLFVYAVEPL